MINLTPYSSLVCSRNLWSAMHLVNTASLCQYCSHAVSGNRFVWQQLGEIKLGNNGEVVFCYSDTILSGVTRNSGPLDKIARWGPLPLPFLPSMIHPITISCLPSAHWMRYVVTIFTSNFFNDNHALSCFKSSRTTQFTQNCSSIIEQKLIAMTMHSFNAT